MILKIWHVQKLKSLDFYDFQDSACAEAQPFGFKRFQGFNMCKSQNLWIFKILRIWHVQTLKSFDFKDCKDLACAET